MLTLPCMQIFTSGQVTAHTESSFYLFPQLPKELRVKIWQHSLQRERILHIRIISRPKQTASQAVKASRFTHKNERYHAIVDGYQVLSKLLRVNSDSRQAALGFYRVHLPCTLTRESTLSFQKRIALGILHLNPEYDFLHISPEPPVKDTLVDFLYHLKTTYDPRGVGLLNLVVGFDYLNGNDLSQLESSDLDPDDRIAFVDTILQLEEVFFFSASRAVRWTYGLGSGFLNPETLFDRPFPIIAKAPSFERLQRDPRPIQEDLMKLFLRKFPTQPTLDFWTAFLKKWTLCPAGIKYRLLFAYGTPEKHQIYDHESADAWLQYQDIRSNKWFGHSLARHAPEIKGEEDDRGFPGIHRPAFDLPEKFRNENLSQAVKPAFGFWLFPLEAVGAFTEESSENAGSVRLGDYVLDLTKHWPELALMNPSSGRHK